MQLLPITLIGALGLLGDACATAETTLTGTRVYEWMHAHVLHIRDYIYRYNGSMR